MAAIPRCSECGEPLVFPADHPRAGQPKPPGTKTCSDAHRQARARRLKRRKSRTLADPEVRDMAATVRGELPDVAHEVMKEELAPLVREQMTDEVLQSIDRLIKLTPSAIDCLQQDLASADETIRQRAYTLLLKYTMGNPSVAPPPKEQAPAAMSVVFNVPRPGDVPLPAEPAESVELRECLDCRATKPAGEFVGSSPKCQACFDGLQAKLTERFK